MILSGFDGMNFTLAMSPRELKILAHSLDQLGSEAFLEVSKHMQAAGFETTPRDSMCVIRQHAMCLLALGNGIKESGVVAAAEEETEEEVKKALPN